MGCARRSIPACVARGAHERDATPGHRRPDRRLRDAERSAAGGQQRIPAGRPRRDAGAGGRVGLRQEHHRGGDRRSAAQRGRHHHGAASLQGARHCSGQRRGAPGAQRQAHRHRVPGPVHLLEPEPDDRPAGGGTSHPAPAAVIRRSHAARDRLAGRRRAARPGQSRARLSPSAFGRHAAARADRHGAGLQSRAADPRRADHRARRHGGGANSRPAGQPAEAGAGSA